MSKKQLVQMWVLALVALFVASGCEGRVLMAGHLTSLGLALGMFYATLNLTKFVRK